MENNMAKILIDTNVFIKKLRMPQKQVKELLETVLKEKDNYCFTEQGIDEFFRNINKKMKEFKNDISNKKNKNLNEKLCDFFDNEKDKEKYKSLQKDLNSMIEQYCLEKENEIDEVANELKKFFEQLKNEKFFIINRTDNVISKANNRHLCGNPPGSDNVTIGDEIIWESALQELKEDLIIVSNDDSFIENKEFLKREFDNDHRKLLEIVKDIEQARKIINLPKDENIEEIESLEKKEEQKSYNDLFSQYPNITSALTNVMQPTLSQYQNMTNNLAKVIQPALSQYQNIANNLVKVMQPTLSQYQNMANNLAKAMQPQFSQYQKMLDSLANITSGITLQSPKIDLPQTKNENNDDNNNDGEQQ
jgi:predicted nucleic acid-binding protein